MMNRQISFPNVPLVRRPALNLRNSNLHLLVQPAVHSSAHQFSFFPHAISPWNQLPNSVYDCQILLSFQYCICTLYQWMLVVYVVTCSVVSFVFLLCIDWEHNMLALLCHSFILALCTCKIIINFFLENKKEILQPWTYMKFVQLQLFSYQTLWNDKNHQSSTHTWQEVFLAWIFRVRDE